MAFTVASGGALYPVGGVANTLQATGFIPAIWSGKLIEKFYASTVLSAISNTDYEGEIKNKASLTQMMDVVDEQLEDINSRIREASSKLAAELDVSILLANVEH